MSRLQFEAVKDPNYGVVLKYPQGWVFTSFGEKGIWAVRDPDNEVGVIVFIVDDLLQNLGLRKIAQISVLKLFNHYLTDVEVLEEPTDNSGKFEARIKGPDSSYVLFGFLRTSTCFLNNYSIKEPILLAIAYNEQYIGTELEPYIAKVMANLPLLVEKEVSLFGKNVPFKKFDYLSNLTLKDLRWSVELPMNYNLRPDIYGFEAFTDRVYVSIKAYHLFISFEDFVNYRISFLVQDYLKSSKYIVVQSAIEENKAFYHVSDPEDKWRIFGYWNLQSYYNLAKEEMFNMVLEKVAIYPSRIELDFLPIISRIFTSFTTGPYWLYEDIGLLELSLKSTISSPQTTPQKIEPPKHPKPPHKSTAPVRSSRYEQWRQKLRDDMKRLYDWEEKLWESTYSAIKTSDVITGMYSLEDKRRKTKLVYTGNIATPSTHRFWKPKKDAPWHSNIVAATSKFTKPFPKHEWEELKWHWNEEIKRLKREIEKKKKKIDEIL